MVALELVSVQGVQLEVEELAQAVGLVEEQVQERGQEMELDLVATVVLGLAVGLVLGYWSALPRVKRLERELETVLRLEKANWLARDSKLAQAHSLAILRAKDSEKAQLSETDSGLVQQELDLERAHLSDLSRESERQWAEAQDWKKH